MSAPADAYWQEHDARIADEMEWASLAAEEDHCRRLAEEEQEQEEAYALAEADRASGQADLAPGIRVVRTSGDFEAPTVEDRFDDAEYDAYDALLDGKPRW